jgi:hypothetical protein
MQGLYSRVPLPRVRVMNYCPLYGPSLLRAYSLPRALQNFKSAEEQSADHHT